MGENHDLALSLFPKSLAEPAADEASMSSGTKLGDARSTRLQANRADQSETSNRQIASTLFDKSFDDPHARTTRLHANRAATKDSSKREIASSLFDKSLDESEHQRVQPPPAQHEAGDAQGDTYGGEGDDGFQAPEGHPTIDADVLNGYSEATKDLGIDDDTAQKLMDRVAPIMQKRMETRIADLSAQWAEETTNDEEFGGDNLTGNLEIAKEVLNEFGSPELRKLLVESGLGNNLHVAKMLMNVGDRIRRGY